MNRRTPLDRRLALLVLLVSMPCLQSCNSANGMRFLELAPLSGDWVVTSLVPESLCAGLGATPAFADLRITQTDASLAISTIGCCTVEAFGTGNVSGKNFTMSLARDYPWPPGSECTYGFTEHVAGTIIPEGFSADADIQVIKSGTCDDPSPCSVQVHLEGRRCEAAGCGILCAGIICPI